MARGFKSPQASKNIACGIQIDRLLSLLGTFAEELELLGPGVLFTICKEL
jgi:hypothetical protein